MCVPSAEPRGLVWKAFGKGSVHTRFWSPALGHGLMSKGEQHMLRQRVFPVSSPDQTTTPGEISRVQEADLSPRCSLNESFLHGEDGLGALYTNAPCQSRWETPGQVQGGDTPNDAPVSCPARWPTRSCPCSKMSPRHTDTRPRGLSGHSTTDLPLLAYWDCHT